MFDFQNLEVYKKSKKLNTDIQKFIRDNRQIDPYIRDQLRRASISVVINIAEGSGKFSKADKRNFYSIARGSVYESVSLFEIIKEELQLNDEQFNCFYKDLEEISKMLFGLIGSQK